MINTGDNVYTTLNYAGGQSTGKVTYYENEFSFIPNSMDNLTKRTICKEQSSKLYFQI